MLENPHRRFNQMMNKSLNRKKQAIWGFQPSRKGSWGEFSLSVPKPTQEGW
jgi:hypothetical protein